MKIYFVVPVVFFIEFWVLHLLENGLVFYGNFSMRNEEIEVYPYLYWALLSLITISIPLTSPPYTPIDPYIIYDSIYWKNYGVPGVVAVY